jgi:NAD(P)-dependent dehydrogenase (short-subunit alcohol dehydrogenase family)
LRWRKALPNTVVAGFDVTNAEAAREGVAAIERNSGAIDILVNNAGMRFRSPLEDFPVEKWELLFATNVSSAFYVGQAVARHMIPRGRGKIINIASVQSELARPGIAPYTATEAARPRPTEISVRAPCRRGELCLRRPGKSFWKNCRLWRTTSQWPIQRTRQWR